MQKHARPFQAAEKPSPLCADDNLIKARVMQLEAQEATGSTSRSPVVEHKCTWGSIICTLPGPNAFFNISHLSCSLYLSPLNSELFVVFLQGRYVHSHVCPALHLL